MGDRAQAKRELRQILRLTETLGNTSDVAKYRGDRFMGLPLARKVAPKDVPIIDLAPMYGDDEQAHAALAQEIAQTCADLGFFYVVNHGLPQRQISDLFDIARQFFNLPAEDLAEVTMSKATHYRGYIPIKTMSQKPQFKASAAELKGNLYEAFQIHPEFPLDDEDVLQGKTFHTQNPWPTELPSVKSSMLQYHGDLTSLAFKMLRLFARGLELPGSGLDHFFKKPLPQLRFLHYPPQAPSDPGENMGLRPHTDSGAFTILAQDEIGGLEILTRDQEWILVPPIKGSYVINLGEMMKVWSDGVYQATPHRVINVYGAERYSIPFFMTPDFDAPLKPVVKNPNPSQAPTFAGSISGAEDKTCGSHLIALYDRIYKVS
jgi:isopenicillin N synthase-like dioxygenase